MTATVNTGAPAALAPEVPPAPVPLREAPQTAPIDRATFRQTFDQIKSKPEDAKWMSIPWQTDLWEARKLAAEQEKPIFAWMMNGNPLGCV